MAYRDLDAEQRVQKCTLEVMMHPKYRPLSGVLMMGVTEVKDDVPTAHTDGLNKAYGREFVMGLDENELRFVILHEALHVSLRHLITWLWMWKEDSDRANAACDMVINIMLVLSDDNTGFIKMPEKGHFDLKYKGMDSGEVFRMMKEDGGSGGAGGFDEHGWEEAKGRTSEQVEGIDKAVGEALQQGGVLAGKLGGELDRVLADIRAPKVDWVEEMREFVVSLCMGREMSTWRRPNRRTVDSGEYMPSSYSEAVGRIGIGVDTSGSIGGATISTFLSEVVGVSKLVTPEMIDLLYWDAKVAAHEKYGPGQYDTLITSTKPKGGGGTSPSCVTTYLQEKRMKLECMIMFTDGHVGSDWGGLWPCPVLWVVAGNKRATARVGKTIHI